DKVKSEKNKTHFYEKDDSHAHILGVVVVFLAFILTLHSKPQVLQWPHLRGGHFFVPFKDRAYVPWALQSRQGEASVIMLLDNGWVRPFALRGFLMPSDGINFRIARLQGK
ncbi:MAG TPA: hypothetical protein VL921_16145, partial [Candidatus Udaeobacter sp.]|nr:hypothetical protein [Candidatus Udaeobacter sp.]